MNGPNCCLGHRDKKQSGSVSRNEGSGRLPSHSPKNSISPQGHLLLLTSGAEPNPSREGWFQSPGYVSRWGLLYLMSLYRHMAVGRNDLPQSRASTVWCQRGSCCSWWMPAWPTTCLQLPRWSPGCSPGQSQLFIMPHTQAWLQKGVWVTHVLERETLISRRGILSYAFLVLLPGPTRSIKPQTTEPLGSLGHVNPSTTKSWLS